MSDDPLTTCSMQMHAKLTFWNSYGLWNFTECVKNNWCLSRSYGIRFGEKDLGLSTYKPWTEQAGGLDSILHEAAQDFEVFKNIQEWNKKIKNP